MKPPLPKYEITIQRSENPAAIRVAYSSPVALQFLRECSNSGFFDIPSFSSEMPGTTTLFVHPCYDFEEVWAFLEANPMVHVLPPITMTSPSAQPKLP
jgi:hypothetical protein